MAATKPAAIFFFIAFILRHLHPASQLAVAGLHQATRTIALTEIPDYQTPLASNLAYGKSYQANLLSAANNPFGIAL
jgi:hypothetical protein